MQQIKTIWYGRLDFGSSKSFSKALEMFEYRFENHYRSAILIGEDSFSEDDLAFVIPKRIQETNEKVAKNTVALIEYVAQFALAGSISYWLLSKGQVDVNGIVEPGAGKIVSKLFLRAKEALKNNDLPEAIELLTQAIERYSNHSRAYELRGRLYDSMGNQDDAIFDFTKSIQIDPYYGKGYFRRAKILISRKEYALALQDLENSIRWSFAKQSYHWQSRRLKAECLIKAERYQEAEKELNFFLSRNFDPTDENYRSSKYATFLLGKVLMRQGRYDEAKTKFETAMEMPSVEEGPRKFEILTQRALAKKQCGEQYLSDLQLAAELGSIKAKELLTEIA